MNYFKRALYSITRKKGKSVILLVIIFILGNLMAGSIAIKQAAENVEKNMKASMGGSAKIGYDFEKTEGNSNESIPALSEDLIDKIAGRDDVKYYDYSEHGTLRSKKYKLFVPEGGEEMFGNGGENASENGEYIQTKGVQYPNVKDIEEGKLNLTGRTFTQEEIDKGAAVAVVPKGFADENNLSIGDTINLKNVAIDYSKMSATSMKEPDALDERDVNLEIIGIFEPAKIQPKKGQNAMGFDPSIYQNYERQNTLYLPNKLINEENKFGLDLMAEAHKDDTSFDIAKYASDYIEPTFVLKSPDAAEKFKEEVSAMLPAGYKVTLSSDAFDKAAGALTTINGLANIVLYVSIIAAVLILTLLIVLFLRDRKHELGIYLSLGEKRYKVIAQVVIETMIIAIIGISTSLVTGNLLAGALSESMLLSQMENSQNIQNSNDGSMMVINSSDDDSGPSSEEILENYQIKLNASYALLIYGIGLGTVLIAVVGPMVYIMRLNPKKIML